MNSKSQRITGYDFARALAIIGMVFVNFRMVMAYDNQSGFLNSITEALTGKAAALFVVLAGIGITLMYNSAIAKNSPEAVKNVKSSLLKRALFLFVVGLSYYFLWPADILHYYGIFIVVGVVLLSFSRIKLLLISISLLIIYTGMCLVFNYEKGWNWDTFAYTDFFTVEGFLRNLFFNGYHPVIPWVAFLITGIWIGRLNLNDKAVRTKTMLISLSVFVATKLLSLALLYIFSDGSSNDEELQYIFGTSPMPPLPLYMISGSSLAVFIITVSVFITKKYANALVIRQLIHTGQLALTIYFIHVVIGMLGILVFFGVLEKSFSIEFVFTYSAVFCIISIVFADFWRRKFKRGPLEMLMRRIAG